MVNRQKERENGEKSIKSQPYSEEHYANYYDLLPKTDVELGEYESILDYAMEKDEIRNIALAGSYGSGKSSVINSYEKKKDADRNDKQQQTNMA